jgi:DNA-binding CsgD family transcriptional regulator
LYTTLAKHSQSPAQSGPSTEALHEALSVWVGAEGFSALARLLTASGGLTTDLTAAIETGRALEQRLREADLEGDLYRAVLESFDTSVFVRPPEGPPRPLNEAARGLQAEHRSALPEALAMHAAAGQIVEVPLAGHPGHHVVVVVARPVGLQRQLGLATRRWELTARQAVVLSHVAEGLSNKEIAAKLECAEATVEQHLTTVYRKAGAQGRSLIVAMLWKLTG